MCSTVLDTSISHCDPTIQFVVCVALLSFITTLPAPRERSPATGAFDVDTLPGNTSFEILSKKSRTRLGLVRIAKELGTPCGSNPRLAGCCLVAAGCCWLLLCFRWRKDGVRTA